MMHEASQTQFKTNKHAAGWNIMPDLALFDVVFHWLQLAADYENTSTQSCLCGLNIGSRGGWGWLRDLESLDFIRVGKL